MNEKAQASRQQREGGGAGWAGGGGGGGGGARGRKVAVDVGPRTAVRLQSVAISAPGGRTLQKRMCAHMFFCYVTSPSPPPALGRGRAYLVSRQSPPARRLGPPLTLPQRDSLPRAARNDLLLGTRDFPQGQVTGDRAGRYSPNYMCSRRTISVRSDSYPYGGIAL
eukprot:SAG25_NODE_160_length_13390_cov_9.002708_20_plen_166_part_00